MSQPPAPSVVLTGTYNSMNKGDAAMELSTLAELQERFPSARCTVISPFPAIDEPFYAPTPVVRGPAVIVQKDSTTVVHPGHIGEVDTYLNILIRPEGAIS